MSENICTSSVQNQTEIMRHLIVKESLHNQYKILSAHKKIPMTRIIDDILTDHLKNIQKELK